MNTLKVITYNTWHGLNGKGTLEFGLLEPQGRKEQRQRLQLQEFKKADADLLFLQEVCPLSETAEYFSNALQMDHVHQLDQSGIKIAGRGFPRNLSTGLTILAKRKLELKKIFGLKLSGGRGALFDWASFQFNEFRYALFAEIKLSHGDALVINTHLHHGPILEISERDRLREFYVSGKITTWQKDGFLKGIQRGMERRLHEGRKLLEEIRKIREKYQLVIVSGDLNDESHSALLEEFQNSGFHDSVPAAKADDPELFSWNHARNETNHSYTQHLNPPIPCYGSPYLIELFRDIDRTPRRIDYTLLAGNAKVDSVKLVFDKPKTLGEKGQTFIGSDHFGVQSDLVFEPS